MKIFCHIPSVCLVPGEVSSQVCEQLEQALQAQMVPVGLPSGTTRQVVEISEDLLRAVNALALSHKVAAGRIVGGVLYAQYLARAAAAKLDQSRFGVAPNYEALRPGQIACLEEAAPMLRDGRIVLSECGTGSGKGRLIAHAAAYMLELRDKNQLPALPTIELEQGEAKSGTPAWILDHASKAQAVKADRVASSEIRPRAVIVCAPSIENVSHLIREWERVRQTLDPEQKRQATVVLGRGQFVSPSSLESMLAEHVGDHDAITQWLNDGMPPGIVESTAHLKKLVPGICGLMADLESLASDCDFEYGNAALDEDSGSQEQILYRTLRDEAVTADLIFTTHAMVCLDNMLLTSVNRNNLLPQAVALFVDEAHQFETIQASIAAKSLSFVRLLSELRSDGWGIGENNTATLTKSVQKTVGVVLDLMKDIPHETQLPIRDGDHRLVSSWNSAKSMLKLLETDLGKLVEKSNKAMIKAAGSFVESTAISSAVRYVKNSITALENLQNDYRGFIEKSPVKGSVSFSVGPSNVDRYLAARWATTPAVMFLSGTLMHIGAKGATPAAAIQELAIPSNRASATTPIHPGWLFSTPKLMMPTTDQYSRYIPPSGVNLTQEALYEWLRECAKVVNLAAQDAKGGILVLMTGYDRLEYLAKALSGDFPSLNDRLIIQSRSQRVSTCAHAFKIERAAGRFPIWLATGAAWTGLDLADRQYGDKDASKDFLLTDIVIPNMPYGLDRTTTHIARKNRMGFGIEVMSTQRRLRQGIGRLVRRDGLLNRRIWIIDGRLQDQGSLAHTVDIRRVLTQYLHRIPFIC